jgi:SAM-dependent methyltransferase
MVTSSPTCRSCRGADGDIVLDLGAQPSSELFPKVDDPGPDPLFPLRMWLCAGCGLAQLADDADVPEEVVGTEPAALTAQRADAVRELVAAGALPPGGTAAEFPSPHGGTWLDLLAEHGFTAVPTSDGADLVVDGCFGVMHEPDQEAALRERAAAVRPGGRLVVQFHSLHAIVAGTQWNALRLGHYAYYSTPAMIGMLARAGFTATTARRFPLYGGTVALVAGRTAEELPDIDAAALDAVVAPELAAGVLRPAAVGALQHSVRRTAGSLREMLVAQRAAGRRVYGYAAASRAVSLLRLADLDASLLLGVADASPAKQDRRMPGTDIPIITPDRLVAAEPDVVLVFVSELVPEARAALPEVERRGGTWVDAGAGR